MTRVIAAFVLTIFAAVQAQRAGYGNSYEQELLRRQYELQQQQRLAQQQAQMRGQRDAMLQEQLQREALLRAAQQQQQQQMPMSNKEKKRLLKAQEDAKKKKQKEYEARQKAFKAAQKKRGATSGRGRSAVSERKGFFGHLFSFKGLALTGGVGYLYIAQRELLFSLTGLLFKYPVLIATWLGRTLLNVIVKPILLRLVALKSGGSSASDVLPGGAY